MNLCPTSSCFKCMLHITYQMLRKIFFGVFWLFTLVEDNLHLWYMSFMFSQRRYFFTGFKVVVRSLLQEMGKVMEISQCLKDDHPAYVFERERHKGSQLSTKPLNTICVLIYISDNTALYQMCCTYVSNYTALYQNISNSSKAKTTSVHQRCIYNISVLNISFATQKLAVKPINTVILNKKQQDSNTAATVALSNVVKYTVHPNRNVHLLFSSNSMKIARY